MRWVFTAGLALLMGCAGRPVVSVSETAAAPQPRPDAQLQAEPAHEAVPVPATLNGKRELFANAHRRLHAKDVATAARLLEILLPVYPELEDYILHYLATCRLRQGDSEDAYRLWSLLHASYPRSLHTADAALERARILRQRGDLAMARDLLAIARDGAPEREVDWELAELAFAERDLPEAHRRFMQVREAAPGSSLGRRAKQRVAELRDSDPSLIPTGDLLAAEVWLLVLEGDSQNALALAEELLARAPDAKRPQRLRALSDTQRAAGHFEEGMKTLRSVYVDYPDSAAARGALYRYASILWNRDNDGEARDAFEEFRRRYPRDSSIPEVSYAIARIDEAQNHIRSALADYAELAKLYPHSKQGREARWRTVWIHYRQGHWQQAAEGFLRLAKGSTDQDRMAARYWQARSLERAGSKDEARVMYRRILEADPTDYYAYWAERQLGIQGPALQEIDATEPSLRIGVAPASAAGDFHLTRAYELQAAGIRSSARAELRAFERSQRVTATLAGFLVDSYPAVDGYRDAIRLAPKVGKRSPRILYPLAFWSLVHQHSTQNGIDPLMVLALMRQESFFDPAARSPADARGAMQLLPRTATQVAERLGRPSPVDDLYDPQVNIPLGIAHLGELHARYGGNWLEILAAYNGGEGAVTKWQQRFGNLDGDEFVESITYRETRDYVKRVLTHYRHYQQIYAGNDRIAALH